MEIPKSRIVGNKSNDTETTRLSRRHIGGLLVECSVGRIDSGGVAKKRHRSWHKHVFVVQTGAVSQVPEMVAVQVPARNCQISKVEGRGAYGCCSQIPFKATEF